MNDMERIKLGLLSLVIFRGLRDDPVIGRLYELAAADGTVEQQVERYAAFAAVLFEEGGDLAAYMLRRAQGDDNMYVRARAHGRPTGLEECLENELEVLAEISRLSASAVRACIGYSGYLPEWKNSRIDFAAEYMRGMESVAVRGYGIYAKHRMFSLRDGAVVPVGAPDPVMLSDLIGYERQRQLVIGNTLAFLHGKPAANALLFGDAGTGKSSTVKAVVNAYHKEGLRLVEITKNQYRDIPAVVEELGRNPLKFILFIDDLSFVEENDDFYALKAVLEGSVAAKTQNLVIYATSNRRHLVKELFSDRSGDDIHRNETIQELCSLSHRFGLTVGFFKPDKKLYLEIVHALGLQYGIKMEGEELELEAERFASGGRSGRAARQFIEHVKSMEA
ncbi:MAG: ATP-binding protein [Eubacteriales bacterium]|nr:ATP-binding protein [Eubacteriales bacterium]